MRATARDSNPDGIPMRICADTARQACTQRVCDNVPRNRNDVLITPDGSVVKAFLPNTTFTLQPLINLSCGLGLDLVDDC